MYSKISHETASLKFPTDRGKKSNILVYNPNKMHKLQSLFNLTTALHVSGVTITHLQEHRTTVNTASGNHYTVRDKVKFTDKDYRYTRIKITIVE
jgi:hypothetical protein